MEIAEFSTPALLIDWDQVEDLGVAPDREVALRLGVSADWVAQMRRRRQRGE